MPQAAAFASMRVIDISVRLGLEDIVYPGDPAYVRTELSSLAQGQDFTLSALSMSAHAGTHLDAPAHFVPGGESIEAIEPARCILPALVVAATGRARVDRAVVEGLAFAPGEAVLFRTDNSVSGAARGGRYRKDYVSIDPEAAELLAARRPGLVGLDAVSVDGPDNDTYPVHHALLGAGALVLESLDLSGVAPGRYTLVCLPLSLPGCEASPVRAVLLSGV